MIDVVKKAAVQAGRKVLFLRKRGLTFTSKERIGDFATDADVASEEIILNELKRSFPNHNFISEEDGKTEGHSEYTWVIDPLDGTTPYSSGLPIFGVSIGLLKNKSPILGVINLPEQGLLFWGERGRGAYVNGTRLKVSGKSELLKSVVSMEYVYVGGRADQVSKLHLPLVEKVRYPFALGCSVASAAYVAKGVFDGYIHSAHPWDFAAGAILITEAGGRVTDHQGRPIDWSKDWIDFFGSNGLIHDEVLSLVKQ